MSEPSTTLRAADLSAWLKERFIPGWIARTCLPGLRGYVEEVRRADGMPLPPARYSTLVTGRLVYSFSMAHRFDGNSASLRAAEHGLGLLLGGRTSAGGFAHAFDLNAGALDGQADLYDLAFVLLALGGYSAASGRTDILSVAGAIGARLDGELADPLGGYREPDASAPRRRQFPQMHLFEAFLLLAVIDPEGGWSSRAARILDLLPRLLDDRGAIDEWYDASWRTLPMAQREGEIGHHVEWAWLLFAHADATGSVRAAEIGRRLFRFGLDAAGIPASGPTHPVPNGVNAFGRLTGTTQPLWPTLELIKAALAATALDGDPAGRRIAKSGFEVLCAHLDCSTLLWRNETGTGAEPAATVPTRVLYHLLPALILFARMTRADRANRAPLALLGI